jgi:RNA-directed DNA polymerase
VSIPKSNGRRRALGIPTMGDRAMQALYLLGLDPIAETLADGHSYGFRLERCCADALDQCHKILRSPTGPNWILEGDIKACFDRISHDWLLDHIPMDKELLRKWLKAGFLEKQTLFATTEGCRSPVQLECLYCGLCAYGYTRQWATIDSPRRGL